jgi:hypothetical protein
MAGNDFEIKKKFWPSSGIFQPVTEVQASFVIPARPEPPESSVPEHVCYDFPRGIPWLKR